MINKTIRIILFIAVSILLSCKESGVRELTANNYPELKQIASTEGFEAFEGNPVITIGPEGSWDAGALGSMTIIKVGDTFHIYYEAWGTRSEKEWDAAEYETLAIGHAISKDGIHWEKDPNNPVVTKGEEGEWDATGVWDPYVIYEYGLFKMWYGGGGGRYPNYGWAYAVSEDGSNFEKHGLIGKNNKSGVEDVHVVHDEESELYYLYYWHGHEDGEDLFVVTSLTETDFDFSESVIVNIEGDDAFWKKFGHVLKNDEGWHMFYSNYIPPHGRKSVVRYAVSEDGINWHAKNKALIYGLDADVLQVTDDLYLMTFAPKNHFDKKDADIRIAVYNGTLTDLASKPPFVETGETPGISGKKIIINLGEDGKHSLLFKPDSEVIISEIESEDHYIFSAYYEQDGDNIHIMGEGFELRATYDGAKLIVRK